MAAEETATSAQGSNKEKEKETPARARHLPSVPGMPTGTAGRVLWWGGLATVAAVGVVDWPVAALIGIGSWVAEQYARAARQPDGAERKAG